MPPAPTFSLRKTHLKHRPSYGFLVFGFLYTCRYTRTKRCYALVKNLWVFVYCSVYCIELIKAYIRIRNIFFAKVYGMFRLNTLANPLLVNLCITMLASTSPYRVEYCFIANSKISSSSTNSPSLSKVLRPARCISSS